HAPYTRLRTYYYSSLLLISSPLLSLSFFHSFFFNDPPPTEIYTLSLHDALPISSIFSSRCGFSTVIPRMRSPKAPTRSVVVEARSEEHTSELQSRSDLVCRLLLEKKKKRKCQEQG